MKYITFTEDETKVYKADYNTDKITEKELEKICEVWQAEDNDGTIYYLAEEE